MTDRGTGGTLARRRQSPIEFMWRRGDPDAAENLLRRAEIVAISWIDVGIFHLQALRRLANRIPYRHHVAVQDRRVESLYEAHARGIFAFLAYRSGDRALAEDLLADTFERVLRDRRRRIKPPANEKAWLYTIALNVLRDHARRAKVEERALAAVASRPADAASESDSFAVRDAVLRAVAELSPEEQEAIALRFGAELTVPEIAAVTKQPLPRAEGRVYRALRKLRPLLEADEPE